MNKSIPLLDRSNLRAGPIELTGRSPMYYFIRLRMQYARRLLESGTASVKDVAATLGYDARFIFDACLHRSLGLRAAVGGWRNLPG
jgi:transcriptional regulator GlxA family with amidase domain